jgi:hypothetical protein
MYLTCRRLSTGLDREKIYWCNMCAGVIENPNIATVRRAPTFPYILTWNRCEYIIEFTCTRSAMTPHPP